jgi:penicillin-binding protein 1C
MDRDKITVKSLIYCIYVKCKLKYILFVLFLAYIFLLSPDIWFVKPVSTVVYDRTGELLGAKLAGDDQWRFPEDTFISSKVEKCLIQYEDEYFYYHPGVNPISLLKATYVNLIHFRIIRGGSTITMQLSRIRNNASRRNIFNKLYEILLSTRLELHYSKRDILQKYLSNAPFGGNVVGVEAASWRYFGRSTRNLSWAEAATLSVLPNSPALIHPGRNRDVLTRKRNSLLLKLLKRGLINQSDYQVAVLEKIPEKPSPLPNDAKHVTDYFTLRKARIVYSSLSKTIQLNCERIAREYLKVLEINRINNIALIVADVKTNQVLAYVGNACYGKAENSPDVDIVQAPRSTGSIIKPLLYALMLQEGKLLPTTLVPDIPTRVSGFNPDNYDDTYNGAVPAKQALSRSLNVPVVRMLQSYGVERFHSNLKKLGMSTLFPDADRYGLTLVVGGAEGKLFDLVGIYSNLSRILTTYNHTQQYEDNDIRPLSLLKELPRRGKRTENSNVLDAGSIYSMFEALLEVNRPEEDTNWKNLASSRRIGWKTGTSYGFRDAWAIGTTPEYVVGVWVGNANGEGRPGLTGITAAAPLMFNIFSSLPKTTWFDIPYDEMKRMVICRQSGFKAGRFCSEIDTILAPAAGERTVVCPYHKMVLVSKDEKFRVTNICADAMGMIQKLWFILPPAQEWYYKKKNPFYKTLPPMLKDCGEDDIQPMEIVYPAEVSKVFIPTELSGAKGSLVIEIAHRNPNATLYWHLDDEYLEETRIFHQLAFRPSPGWHKLTVIDDQGHLLVKKFEILE